jgi:SAM-dependent methyltransferase
MRDFEGEYFRKYYEGCSAPRDSQYKFSRYLRVLRKFQEHGTLLDIGCGYGGFLSVSTRCYISTGIDISEHALLRSKEFLKGSGTRLVCASPEALPFSAPFDAVVAFDCLEHIPALDSSLREISRVQKKGGILMIVVPVYDTLIGKLVQILDDDVTHIHKESRYFWIDKVESAGYQILRIRGAWRYLLMGRWYLNFTIPFWRISPALMIVAQRKPDNPQAPAR